MPGGGRQPEHPTAQAEVAKLLNVIGNADRVTVFIMNGNKIGQQIYASSDLRDLEALRASISIDSTGNGIAVPARLRQSSVCSMEHRTSVKSTSSMAPPLASPTGQVT